MNCAEDEILRAKLDGQLDDSRTRELDIHLADCAGCRRRLSQIAEQRDHVQRAIASIEPSATEPGFDAAAAFARLQQRGAEDASPASTESWQVAIAAATRRRRVALWTMAAAALAFVVVFTAFEPARTWGQKMLEMLRVNHVAAVPVDSSLLPSPGNTNQTALLIQKLISDEVTVTMKPGKPQPVANAAAATQLAGFPVRLLGDQGTPNRLNVIGAAAANMVIHRDRLEAILQSAGRTDLKIPPSVDGAMLAVYLPKSVIAFYGNCPPLGEHGGSNAATGQTKGDFSSCAILSESPSPTVSVPKDLDLNHLAAIGLQFTGMSARQAADFVRTVDWTSTLLIPVPRRAAGYTEVNVDGAKGVLLAGMGRSTRGYTLIWVKNGIVYAIRGLGDPAAATAMGDSLSG